ncbi:hypothetical protein CHISP_0724 [Chitinispirillum alkaliphilum]|nr:hypothetical protein CHISP_0724 [Chitinispirillum alkaliphilum]
MEKIEIQLIPTSPNLGDELLAFLSEHLQSTLGAAVTTGPLIVLPSSMIDRQRGQYDGEAILRLLREYPDSSVYKLALVDEDCYGEGVKYLFGESMLRGHELFVALPRLKETFYGREENRELFFERVLKQAVHEMGHALGLLHCPNQSCVMYLSSALQHTDRKGGTFCPRCISILKENE